jgi:hypothetical protein
VNREFLRDGRSKLAFRTNSGKMRVTKPYISEPNACFADHTNSKEGVPVWSVDKNYRKACNVIDKELSEAHQPESHDGFSTNGITGDFSAINCVSGIKAIPGNAPVVDADSMIAAKGLAGGLVSKRHERIFDTLWDLMFSTFKESDTSISRISSSTIPLFTSAVPTKQAFLELILNNVDDVLNLVLKDDFKTLQAKYGVALAYVLGERHQPDGGKWVDGVFVPKPRFGFTREGIFSDDPEVHKQIEVDKTSHLKDVYGLTNCSAMRVRTVFGLAGFVTYFMSCLLNMAREHYLKEYAFTWKHSTREQIFDKVKDSSWVTGLDVTQMDQHVPSWFLDRYAKRWESHVHPGLAKLFQLMNTAPYFCPQLGPGESPFWVGNPYSASGFWPRPGLASGRPDVPDLGKFWMTFVYACMIDDINHDILEQAATERSSLAKFLKGGYKIKLLDMGDDAVVMGDDSTQPFKIELSKRIADKTATPYAILDVEKVVAFLGNVFMKDKITHEILLPEPNPVTLIVNRFAREHSVYNQNHSQYWGAGLLLALEHYGKSSKAMEVWEHMEDIWRVQMPGVPTPTIMAKAHARLNPIGGIAGVSDADIQVLLDPSKLHYKFTPDMLSDGVKDKFTTNVPAEKIRRAFNNLCTIR